jgi:hypothetical protein
VTVEYRPLRRGEIDHEILWSSVLVLGGALGWWWLQAFGVPPLVCPFKAATGFPCVTCGATRALLALVQGQVSAAFVLNPLVPLAAMTALSYVLYSGAVVVSGRRRLRTRVRAWEALVLRGSVIGASTAVWGWLVIDGR